MIYDRSLLAMLADPASCMNTHCSCVFVCHFIAQHQCRAQKLRALCAPCNLGPINEYLVSLAVIQDVLANPA